ncbi:MAG TPA: hypothetical protein VE398_18900 [Acidobacteriota bacterium]|nr:hypothetical protein [Acidobacteriota bacterium]
MVRQMKLNLSGRLILLLTVTVLLAPIASVSAQDSDPNHLSGGWAITITLPDNPLGLPTTVQILGNFTQDGSFIFSDSLGKFGPGLTQSPGHGQWARTAKGEFTLDSWHLVFDNAGQFFGLSRGQASIKFDPKEGKITGTNFLQLIPNVGGPLPGLPGKLEGHRLAIEPPPPTP